MAMAISRAVLLNFAGLLLFLFCFQHQFNSINAQQQKQSLPQTELQFLERQKPILKLNNVYSTYASFDVDVQSRSGPMVKCGDYGTHVVQYSLKSDPGQLHFAKDVQEKPEGFIIQSLTPNTGYLIRVSCKFLTRPVTWSDDREIFTPIQARFNPSQSGGSGQQDHHHHHHTGQQHDGEEQDNNSNHDSDEGGGGGGANKNDPAAPNNEIEDPNGKYDLPTPGILQRQRRQPANISNSTDSEKQEKAGEITTNTTRIKETQLEQTTNEKADKNKDSNNSSVPKFWGVVGEWANLTCISSIRQPVTFEWVHISPNNENITLQERLGLKIISEGNISLLTMILKSEEMLGYYICNAKAIKYKKIETQKLELLKGRRPPKIHLTPELIQNTSARFKVERIIELHPNSNTNATEPEDNGEDLPILGFVVWLKRICHLGGSWVHADITEDMEGFTIHNLIPNEGYYVKAALRNVGSVGDYGEYWKIRTSSAIMLKSSHASTNSVYSASFYSCFLMMLVFLFFINHVKFLE